MAQFNMNPAQVAKSLTDYHLVYRNLFKNLIKSATMPLTQYHILDMLANNPNMRMGEISQLMAISRPNLTPLIDKLVGMRYVDRVADHHDRRVTYINITPEGKAALEVEREAIERNVEQLCSRLTKEEYNNFSAAISTLVELSKKI